ncbi:hypothetical protein L0666_08210 [Octadecabacter sp. CECT 8868]|uniref:hypothetical protein n=1 Tax=Octadecabacter algicola TaxID=2909342 RepID=UPI001F2E035D|nr:hypothetical protein [Octadecabacter algicola]MCF2904969.1 hypothetical protein [Octadecabacter algicola]
MTKPQRNSNPAAHRCCTRQGFDEWIDTADAAMSSPETSGLDQLPPKARKLVVKPRKAAISAQKTVERKARHAVRKTSGFVHDQPLMAEARNSLQDEILQTRSDV